MIPVKADHFNLHAGHTSQQPMQDLFEIIPDSRLQDPPAVFADPHHVILKTICTVSSQSYFHTSRTYRLRAHSSTGKPLVFCLRPHKTRQGAGQVRPLKTINHYISCQKNECYRGYLHLLVRNKRTIFDGYHFKRVDIKTVVILR